jgi:hypothetical protein
MPLSRIGVPEIAQVAQLLGLRFVTVNGELIESESNWNRVDGLPAPGRSGLALAEDLVAAGATVHYPAVVLFVGSRRIGRALVGYKGAATWARLVSDRLKEATSTPGSISIVASPEIIENDSAVLGGGVGLKIDPQAREATITDVHVAGSPGAYFRSIPGYSTVAFGEGEAAYLLELKSTRLLSSPGYIDLVPSPDGKFLVSPGRERTGLRFYRTRDVLGDADEGQATTVRPFFADAAMSDHYPSVGIIYSDGGRVTYRVLTSWSDKVRFRDYEINWSSEETPTRVQPVGDPVSACEAPVSIATISPRGDEIAARDERQGRTTVYQLDRNGMCTEVLDLGIQAGKVAWSPDASLFSFTVPRGVVRDGRGVVWVGRDATGEMSGVFVLDRATRTLVRVPGSEPVGRLTFPDFIGRDSIIFLLPPDSSGSARFRIVCCAATLVRNASRAR